MIIKGLGLLGILTLMAGCEVVVAHPHRGEVMAQAGPAPVVAPPPPPPAGPVPVAEAPPAYVEEGTTVGGVVVATPPGPLDYVYINGGWFYWHPGLRVWVHAHRGAGWRPDHGHVFYHWRDHPMYRRR